MTTDRWIEAILDHVPPEVNVAVHLRGRGDDQLLTFETAANLDAAKAITYALAKTHGIADEHVSFQERNRHRQAGLITGTNAATTAGRDRTARSPRSNTGIPALAAKGGRGAPEFPADRPASRAAARSTAAARPRWRRGGRASPQCLPRDPQASRSRAACSAACAVLLCPACALLAPLAPSPKLVGALPLVSERPAPSFVLPCAPLDPFRSVRGPNTRSSSAVSIRRWPAALTV